MLNRQKGYFMPLYPTKSDYWKLFSTIFNNISEQNCLDKTVFNSVNKLVPWTILLQTKSNFFLDYFALGQLKFKPQN